ncbi:4-hydroxy-tetrahydrodipicolinate reductase [Pseudogracilibacillus sp. ICA-222130]|uniref:4-hydroxy-tetrahydrodipicolinate reductase n=1 Tax=Pseudogracilibacillus sp. ICA-222130 TaxID=3134655 RepID=UPI0030C1C8F7
MVAIKIILAGPRGKMGKEAVKMIENEPKFELVSCIDRKNNGKKLSEVLSSTALQVPIFEDPESCFSSVKADVFIDLTIPNVGYINTKAALERGIHAVVGTSGFTDEQLSELTKTAEAKGVGCIIAPNFALGAVLMMVFSKMAAKYFPDVEVIEKHHDQKIDAPSGTAVKTVEMIKEVRQAKQQGHPDEYESIEGARGANIDGIHVHSMRLPGLVAHQEVVFGSKSQLLSIKHDSFHRESFMDGLHLAVEEVSKYKTLVYGLENILDLQ